MRAMEREHRSLVVAMMRPARRGGPPGRRLCSLERGLESLTDALAAAVAPVRLNAPVLSLARRPSGGYAIPLASGERIEADAVVLATPPPAAAAPLRDVDAEIARKIGTIEAAGPAGAARGVCPPALP